MKAHLWTVATAAMVLVAGHATSSAQEKKASEEKGLVAHYTFDEGSGTVARDVSGNGHNGKIHRAKYVEMEQGHALAFDGIDAYVDCGNPKGLNMGADDFSVELWFRMDKPLRTVFVGKQGASWTSPGWRISYGDLGKNVEFHMPHGAQYYAVSYPLKDKSWHHVVAVRKAKTGYLYMDGKLRAKKTDDFFGADVSCDNHLVIGSLPGWGKLAGAMDEVRIYKRALTEKEIASRYKAKKDKMKLMEPKPDDKQDEEDEVEE